MKSFKCRILSLLLICVILGPQSSSKLMAANIINVDPSSVREQFEATGLLNYLSSSLDAILGINPDDVISMLGILGFSSVPQNFRQATDDFAHSAMSLAPQVVQIDTQLQELDSLVNSLRFVEAGKQMTHILNQVQLAYSKIDDIEAATLSLGKTIDITSAPKESKPKLAYQLLLNRIALLRQMLTVDVVQLTNLMKQLKNMTASISSTNAQNALDQASQVLTDVLDTGTNAQKQIAQAQNKMTQYEADIDQRLSNTELFLDVEPRSAFVGDSVHFEGYLTTNKMPIASREIIILIDDAPYFTTATDPDGHYEGQITLPLQYVPEINFQAKYSPSASDAMSFRSSASPTIAIALKYYTGNLNANSESKAYPGRSITFSGSFAYSPAPDLNNRKVEIYLDNVLIDQTTQPMVFRQVVPLDPATTIGKHIITLNAPCAGRYAPLKTTFTIDVVRATLMLDSQLPTLVFFPGEVHFTGNARSEFGPLSQTELTATLMGSKIDAISDDSGSFKIVFKTSMSWKILSKQDLRIKLTPQEPWIASTTIVFKPMVLSLVSLAIIGFMSVIIVIGLHRRWWNKLTNILKLRHKPLPQPLSTPVGDIIQLDNRSPIDDALETVGIKDKSHEDMEPAAVILRGYSDALKLVQSLVGLTMAPQQTLNEFARQTRPFSGRAGLLFDQLTVMTTRLIYSSHKATEEEANNSRHLSHSIKETLAGENN